MSINLIVSNIITLDHFCKNPKRYIYLGSKSGIIEIIKNKKPIAYVLETSLLNRLVSITYKQYFLKTNKTRKNKTMCDEKDKSMSSLIVEKKFKMYDKWVPDVNFIEKSSVWGIDLQYPVTRSELSLFISYWKIEDRYFYHIQWQQKLAYSLEYSRHKNIIPNKRKNIFVDDSSRCLEKEIPDGFRDK